MRELCAQAGVAVVFVPSLPKTGVSGATRFVLPACLYRPQDKAIAQNRQPRSVYFAKKR